MRVDQIRQADPGAEYRADREELNSAIQSVLDSGRYILNGEVEAFEKEFAEYVGSASPGVGLASGTDALVTALRALEIKPSARVVPVSMTAVATVAAIEIAGAVPVFVDVDPKTLTLDAGRLADLLEGFSGPERPVAVVVVHLYGEPANMDEIMQVANRHNLLVIEDCAQAHGATSGDAHVGLRGDAAAFSFYPTKNLGAIGDAGMLISRDPAVVEKAARFRQYGWRKRYVSDSPGINSRLDEIQAAILRVKLRHFDHRQTVRRELAAIYDEEIHEDSDLVRLPSRAPGHGLHQYVIRSSARDRLQNWLAEQGISTAVHYPLPVHTQPAYLGRLESGPLAVTELAVEEVLSLPMHPYMSREDVTRVARAITSFPRS
jgi:dTDP-4-amino-4,6-dideoxygalactose transaminase